jgi:hypothetical protein
MPGSEIGVAPIGGGEYGVGVTDGTPGWFCIDTPSMGGGVGTAASGEGRPAGGVGAPNDEDLGGIGAGTIDGSAIMVLAMAALPGLAGAVRSPPQPRQNL